MLPIGPHCPAIISIGPCQCTYEIYLARRFSGDIADLSLLVNWWNWTFFKEGRLTHPHNIELCCSVAKSWVELVLWWEKAMAPHSSTLAWKIPWTEEPGGLQSMGSLRVGHDWATSLSLFTFMHWRRKWQPTPVFLPGESQGRWGLVGCCLWGRTESDTTEAT